MFIPFSASPFHPIMNWVYTAWFSYLFTNVQLFIIIIIIIIIIIVIITDLQVTFLHSF